LGNLSNRFGAMKHALFGDELISPPLDTTYKASQPEPLVVDSDSAEPPAEDQDRDTGSIGAPRPTRPQRPQMRPQTGAAVSHFERQRAMIDSFDEDYADRWDKVKLFVAKMIALVLPVVAIVSIGDELARYFYQFGGGSYGPGFIAYSGEAGLAALTYMLGSMFGRGEKSGGHYAKASITFLIWLAFVLASAWGQWAVAKSALPKSAGLDLEIAIWLRIGMACMLDAASVAIMFWRGKSLTKYLNQLTQKADATIRVNEAELAIERAQATAEQRKKEDDLYLKGKEQVQAVVMRVQELQGQALIEQARAALPLPEGGQSSNGRKLRGGW
jgi:hypothetical protein